jgi:hypothetical protein
LKKLTRFASVFHLKTFVFYIHQFIKEFPASVSPNFKSSKLQARNAQLSDGIQRFLSHLQFFPISHLPSPISHFSFLIRCSYETISWCVVECFSIHEDQLSHEILRTREKSLRNVFCNSSLSINFSGQFMSTLSLFLTQAISGRAIQPSAVFCFSRTAHFCFSLSRSVQY